MKYPEDFINKVICGDCIDVMKDIPDKSIDSIVTDPPYNLHFMGKSWDKNLLHEQWLKEAFRVLKPGASALIMGGTRTFHRLMVAIEDTGFLIKDTIMWMYGSGFPKAQDLGKMIDKRNNTERKVIKTEKKKAFGYGDRPWKYKEEANINIITAPTTKEAKKWDGWKIGGIKPAYEPIVWAVKPPEGTYVDNVLKWGVGAVNVDSCRVSVNPDVDDMNRSVNHKKRISQTWETGSGFKNENNQRTGVLLKGRFPTNVILDEEAGRMLDEQSGELKSGAKNGLYNGWGHGREIYGDVGPYFHHCSTSTSGASRFFYCAKASRRERNKGIVSIKKKLLLWSNGTKNPGSFQSKDTNKSVENNHPTVKPVSLMTYLIKLVTREEQVILDPFFGSGTTGISCQRTNRKFIGIEKESDYCEIANSRMSQGVF